MAKLPDASAPTERLSPRTPPVTDIGMMLGLSLRTLRLQRGMTLAALARAAGLGRATLHQLEAGEGNPTIETLFTLASALGVPLSQLVSDRTLGYVHVIRSSEGVKIAGTLLDARLVRRVELGLAILEVYDVVVRHGPVARSAAHAIGVQEHFFVTSGRLMLGPVGNAVVLEAGDYTSFPGNCTHVYQALGGTATALLLMAYPPTSPPSAPLDLVTETPHARVRRVKQ